MLPNNSAGSSKFPGGQQVMYRTAQTAFVRVVTPRKPSQTLRQSMLTSKEKLLIAF